MFLRFAPPSRRNSHYIPTFLWVHFPQHHSTDRLGFTSRLRIDWFGWIIGQLMFSLCVKPCLFASCRVLTTPKCQLLWDRCMSAQSAPTVPRWIDSNWLWLTTFYRYLYFWWTQYCSIFDVFTYGGKKVWNGWEEQKIKQSHRGGVTEIDTRNFGNLAGKQHLFNSMSWQSSSLQRVAFSIALLIWSYSTRYALL